MHGKRRYRQGLFASACLLSVAGLAANLIASPAKSVDKTKTKAPKIVSPPDRAVLLSGNLDVIYRGENAELEVNSRPVPWEDSYRGAVHVGHVHLSPGLHRVKVGDRELVLCVALNEM